MPEDMIAGRYRLLEPLGRGAMSAVWLAEDEELGRRVAVKTLAPTADRTRFEREARAAAALSHPNICGLYDYGEADGRPFMVLEYLPGGSLEERLQSGKPLPDDDATRIATELAAGLAHAHARGLVHRDLKPANVLFDAEGRAKIADFGIARMSGTGTLTEAGTVLGTASYISPEQASGAPAGPASDVYSFGVILFRMLTGVLPFVSTNAMELVRMHRDDPPPTISSLRRDAPPRLESVATAALAKDPALRPADGAALLAELRGGSSEGATTIAAPATAEATQIISRPPSSRRRVTPLAAIVGALVLLAAGVAAALIATGGGGDSSPPASTPNVSLPNVSTARSTTEPTTTAEVTTEPTTTAPTTTTEPTTTTAPTTTRATTTAPATTIAPPPTTTIELPPTTIETLPTTTETVPTTTAAPDQQTTTTP